MSKVISVEFGKRSKACPIESGLGSIADVAEEAVGPFAALVKRRHEPTMFDFEWATLVTRLSVDGRENPDDEVDYTQAGRDKFGEIFIKVFGFPRLPRTWGELEGVWDYCGAIDSAARSGMGLEIMAEYSPGQIPVMQAYLNGNRFELKRWHTEECLQEITDNWVSSASSED
jgi:hypothetical protein